MKKFNLKALVVCALLAALSIVFGKFLALPVGNFMRFSFENTPLFIAGYLFGPVWGALVGLVADILGSILRGYDINLIITLGAIIIGASGGISFMLLKNSPLFIKVLLSVFIANLIGSVIVKTFGLQVLYQTPYHVLFLWRCLNYVIMTAIDTLVLYFLFKNKSFRNITESLK